MVIAFVGIGANLGDRADNIRLAIHRLGKLDGTTVVAVSTLLENPAVGGPTDSPPFLNAAARLETLLPPTQLLRGLLAVEKSLGRSREEKWGPRTIDLDLLLYGNEIINDQELTVPHPLMQKRLFVLQPLVEIAPGVIHPTLKRTIADLLRNLQDCSTKRE